MSSPADTHAPVPVPVPGERTLGGYEVLAALKSGGMGDVLLARRVGAHGFEKLVAIKTMRAEFRDRQDARKMFFDEAQKQSGFGDQPRKTETSMSSARTSLSKRGSEPG